MYLFLNKNFCQYIDNVLVIWNETEKELKFYPGNERLPLIDKVWLQTQSTLYVF